MTARSPASRRARRAVSSALIVGGIVMRDRSCVAVHRPSRRSSAPSSTSIRSVCSTNSGLPSAISVIRTRASGSSSSPPSRPWIEPVGLARRQRRQRDELRVRLRRHPLRPDVEELGAREAEQEHRRAAEPVGEVLEQVEERRLAPLDVVEHGHERALRAEVLEQLADPPEGLLDGGAPGVDAEERHEPLGDERGVAVGAEELGDLAPRQLGPVALADPGGVHEGRRDRPERDALAVREAAPLDDGRLVAEPGRELVAEARLARTGRAEHGDDLARPLGRDAREGVLEPAELALAADEVRREVPRPAARAGDDLVQLPRDERLGLALDRERPDGRRRDGVADEVVGGLAEQDLARLGGLLEAGGDVDGVAEDRVLPARAVADEDLAGVDPGPGLDREPPRARELRVELLEGFAHLGGGADRAQRVVLVDLRDAEHRHHRVADELLDAAAVALDRHAHRLEVPGHDLQQRLGVQAVPEQRRVRRRRRTRPSRSCAPRPRARTGPPTRSRTRGRTGRQPGSRSRRPGRSCSRFRHSPGNARHVATLARRTVVVATPG